MSNLNLAAFLQLLQSLFQFFSIQFVVFNSPLRICIWNLPVAAVEIACEPSQTVGNLHKFRLVTSDVSL